MKLAKIIFVLILVCAFSAFAQETADTGSKKLKIVTTFSVLQDITYNIVKDRADVYNIVGPNRDMHGYQLTPADMEKLLGADAIIANGLAFEPWLNRIATNPAFKGTVIIAATRVDTLRLSKEEAAEQLEHFMGEGAATQGDEENGKGLKLGYDPHAWHNIANARRYVSNITRALIKIEQSAANAAEYAKNSKEYTQKLNDLEQWASNAFKSVQPPDRKMITTHDALNYFATTYRIKTYSPLGFSTTEQPSAQQIAAVIDAIRQDNIKAMFLENMTNPAVLDQITRETGLKQGGILYTDALNDQKDLGDTYINMYKHNVETIVKAMGGGV